MIWEDPAPTRDRTNNGTGRMAAFVAELMARPGEWALYGICAYAPTGQQARFKERYHCECTTRKDGDKWKLYVRWPTS